MIEGIGDEEMAFVVHGDTERVIEAGFKGRATIPSIVCDTHTGQPVQTARRAIPSADKMVVRIGKNQVSRRIERNR